jgi:hypothetical protein
MGKRPDPYTGNVCKIVRPNNINSAAPVRPPHFTYRGGPLISTPQVFVIFWGTQWNEAFYGMPPILNKFFDDILVSPLIDQLSEYSINNFHIGHGSRVGSLVITDPKPSKFIFDFQIKWMLQQKIAQGVLPPASPNNLYFVYTPPGSAVIQGFFNFSCISFCGYHDAINNSIFYAVINYPACNSCKGTFPDLDALKISSSHELCEAITDPVPGSGWYDDLYGEIGDVCEWQTKQVNGEIVQKEWSNGSSSCV